MAEIQLFPLIPKAPGFLRDGTLYQGEYCTQGQWVRFYQGKPKKIGGQLAIERFLNDINPSVPQNCSHVTSVWAGDSIIYIAVSPVGIFSNITKATEPHKFIAGWKLEVEFDNAINANYLWQSQVVINININENNLPGGYTQTNLVLFGSDNLQNINNVTTGKFYKVALNGSKIESVTDFQIYEQPVAEGLQQQDLLNLNGGIVFVDNFLFIYGTKGTVIWSTRENPFVFKGGSSGRINISNDKVIYSAGVRGGNNPPTLLFWTMNSVVRVSNQTNTSSITETPDFQVDIISRESSILSSRSVVEYDGIFYWLGADRIFFYNGLVREIPNITNFDWFFKNLDVLRRQLVFGVKNSEKGEVWWYFPVIGVQGGCSSALIYNIRENSWYSTNIIRTCGFFDGSSGKMITYGPKITQDLIANDPLSYIWVHEEGHQQIADDKAVLGITSNYTTPIFSLTAFSPFGEGAGINRDLWVERIEPDFGLRLGGKMTMNVNASDYADIPAQVIFTSTITGGGGKVDIRCQGRNLTFTFSTTEDFIHGYPLIGIKQGSSR